MAGKTATNGRGGGLILGARDRKTEGVNWMHVVLEKIPGQDKETYWKQQMSPENQTVIFHSTLSPKYAV